MRSAFRTMKLRTTPSLSTTWRELAAGAIAAIVSLPVRP
jgi:hypothetical protein